MFTLKDAAIGSTVKVVKLRGYELSLRKADAENIEVEEISEA